MPTRRSVLKALHWLSIALIAWFYLVEPGDFDRLGGAALATHTGMGLLLALVTGTWFAMYLRNGLASRPGPRLPGWARRLHPLIHRALYYGVPFMVFTGALAGVAAPYVIHVFGVIPVFPGLGTKGLHKLMQDFHELTFNLLIATILAHASYHLWRHYWLRDNALKIMVPKRLHRYL